MDFALFATVLGVIVSIWWIYDRFISPNQPATKKDVVEFATKADIEELRRLIEQQRKTGPVELDGLPDKGPKLRTLIKNALQAEKELKYTDAIAFWQQVLAHNETDDSGRCSAYLQIASLYFDLAQYYHALESAETAKNLAEKINNNVVWKYEFISQPIHL